MALLLEVALVRREEVELGHGAPKMSAPAALHDRSGLSASRSSGPMTSSAGRRSVMFRGALSQTYRYTIISRDDSSAEARNT
jgi:hypothetical protein